MTQPQPTPITTTKLAEDEAAALERAAGYIVADVPADGLPGYRFCVPAATLEQAREIAAHRAAHQPWSIGVFKVVRVFDGKEAGQT